MKLCSKSESDMEVFAPMPFEVLVDNSDKPKCPLCLLAVSDLQQRIKSDKSKDNIRNALKNLCSHLTQKLRVECDDFVETYTNELVEMLITDFTPEQICVYLKICTGAKDTTEFADERTIVDNENGDIRKF